MLCRRRNRWHARCRTPARRANHLDCQPGAFHAGMASPLQRQVRIIACAQIGICRAKSGRSMVQDPQRKINRLPFSENRHLMRPSRPDERDVRVVTNVGRNAVAAQVLSDVQHRCGRRNRVVLARPCRAKFARDSKGLALATVANAGSPRRSRISRKTIAQGRPVVTACTCGFRACANFLCARAPGAAATRPSLRPLHARG